MTTKHPAHGPVSLDRLHQISEILSKAAAQSDGGNLGYAMADAVKVINGAIASFGAEPVAWQWEYRDKRHVTNDQRRAKIVAEDGEVLVQPLYTAPPTSVVPPAIEPDYDVIKGILPTSNPDEYACCIAADMWNACRAAMLQAGSHLVIGIDRESGPDRTGEVRYCAPPGYVMVPVEPTEKMVIEGFESEPDEFFSKSEEWDAYQEMSGCEQAAHRAKLCWAAMIKAAPKQENK
ncbi:hypothetical protein I5463_04575 [Citrobacter freundii]|uniref:hypothetical protein n=1 Tax=Citrobacter freundii TaxID=546 RepID=UPI00190744DA|nr:hypothetical protein [Citrobacter freundii]MBJ9059588.1 hypothetical protein [Citrobacter freundii]